MTETVEQAAPKAPSEAISFAEHKKLRAAPPAEKADTATAAETQNTEKNAPPAGEKRDKSENAPGSDTGKETQSQETKKPHEDPGIKARLSELASQRKAEKERADKLERELEELRKAGTRKPEGTPAGTEAKPNEDAEPDFKTFYEEEEKSGKHQSWAELQSAALKRYNAAMREFSGKQSQKTERERQANEARAAATQKLTKAREKYADFDQVTAGDPATGEGLVMNNAVFGALLSAEDGMDILYEAGKLPAEEKKRIAALPPQGQLFEMAKIQARLAGATSNAPGKERQTATPITKAPPPATPVTGVSAAAPKSTADARSLEEHKRLRRGGT